MAGFVVEMTGDEAKLLKSLQKVVEQQRKMADGNKKIEQSSQRSARAAKQMGDTGNKSLAQMKSGAASVGAELGSMATAALSVGTAINLVRGQWQREIDQMIKSTEGLMRQIEGFAKLGQGRVIDGRLMSGDFKRVITSLNTPFTSRDENIKLADTFLKAQPDARMDEVAGAVQAASGLTGIVDPESFIKNVAAVNQLSPDLAEEDVRDVALQLFQGGISDASPFMKELGKSTGFIDLEDQVQLAISSSLTNQGPEAIAEITKLLAAKPDASVLQDANGRGLTERDRFLKTKDPSVRFETLLQNADDLAKLRELGVGEDQAVSLQKVLQNFNAAPQLADVTQRDLIAEAFAAGSADSDVMQFRAARQTESMITDAQSTPTAGEMQDKIARDLFAAFSEDLNIMELGAARAEFEARMLTQRPDEAIARTFPEQMLEMTGGDIVTQRDMMDFTGSADLSRGDRGFMNQMNEDTAAVMAERFFGDAGLIASYGEKMNPGESDRMAEKQDSIIKLGEETNRLLSQLVNNSQPAVIDTNAQNRNF